MKDKKKYHWLKVDFNKWKDEDESEDEGQSQDLEEVRFSLSHILRLNVAASEQSLIHLLVRLKYY
jgi:hypothetical protein